MKFFRIFVFVCFVTGILVSPVWAEVFNPTAKFYTAGVQYKDGRYAEAAASYEEILANGLRSGELYYNLGNSYFKSGQLGKAILNYERAKRFMPRDGDLKSNDEFARTQVQGFIDGQGKSFLEKILANYADYFTADELALGLLFLGGLMGCVYLLKLFFHWPSRISFAVMAVLLLLAVVQITALVIKFSAQENLAVIIQSVDAKFEPTAKGSVHFSLPEGNKVTVLEQRSDWAKIQRLDGKIGWAEKKSLEKI